MTYRYPGPQCQIKNWFTEPIDTGTLALATHKPPVHAGALPIPLAPNDSRISRVSDGGAKFEEETASIASKIAIQRAGGGTLELAIAMMECKHLISEPHDGGDPKQPCYVFGDREPNRPDEPVKAKTGDAANFGLFKMNWFMIKQCPSAKLLIGNRDTEKVWREVGAKINGDRLLGTKILLEAEKQWSMDSPNKGKNNFWAGHRYGQSGLEDLNCTAENWRDFLDYYERVMWIKSKCDENPKRAWNSKVRYYRYLENI